MMLGETPSNLTGWAAIALEGSAGAVLGLIGLFGVFMLTRRHERRMDQEAVTARDQRAEFDRLTERISEVVEASHRFRGLDDVHERESCSRIALALLLLSTTVSRTRPNLSQWSFEESRAFTRMGVNPATDPRATSWEAGRVAAVLVSWLSSGEGDESFERLAEGIRAENDKSEAVNPERSS